MYPFDISNFDSNEEKLDKIINWIKKLGENSEEENYRIYFSPTTIKRYIELLIKKQEENKRSFYPSKEEDLKKYFNKIDSNFNYNSLKYNSSSDLTLISKIIANQGKSGYSYLENIENVINLNKPTLIFYGFEQLSAFFRNLHFNFTNKNAKYNKIRRRFQRHGIDAYEFKNIEINISLEKLIEKKIKLKLEGLCPLFFLIFLSDHFASLIDLFIDEKEISLIELLRNFFYPRNRYVPDLVRSKFEENFGKDWPIFRLDSIILTIYLISFLFSHISRYKMHAWTSLIENDEKNIAYYVNYLLKYGKVIFIKCIFTRLFYNEVNIGGTFHKSLF